MHQHFLRSARNVLRCGVAAAVARAGSARDYRAALCRWEDDLFARFREGHRILSHDAALALIESVFGASGSPVPELQLVAGFDDPRIGGFADVAGHRILIEEGCLYRYLLLHESAHLLVPEDRRHGPAFIYVLQMLYQDFIGIPEAAIREMLLRHGLPAFTDLPEPAGVAIAA